MACIDIGEHPIQLRDHLAGMDSIRGVQASAVSSSPRHSYIYQRNSNYYTLIGYVLLFTTQLVFHVFRIQKKLY